MKKTLALLLAVILCVSFTFSACADRGDDLVPLTWEEAKGQADSILEGGRFIRFYQAHLMVWMPASYLEVALTRQDINEGVIGYYLHNGTEPYGMEVVYRQLGLQDREAYEQKILAEGAEDVLFTTINGKPGMVFNRPDKNAVCAAIPDEFGAVTEFRFFPASSDGFYFEAQMMICSIQPIS